MRIVHRRIVVRNGRASRIRLYFLGDSHYGAAATAKGELAATIAAIQRDPDAYWLGMGDYLDAIAFGDKRFDARTLDPEIWRECGQNIGHYWDTTKRHYAQLLRPIYDKCLGLIEGNHEQTALTKHNLSVVQYLIDDYCDWATDRRKPLAVNPWVEPLDDCAVLLLHFAAGNRRTDLVVYATHGAGRAMTTGGRINRLESVMAWLPEADLYVCGHFHDRIVRPREVLTVSRNIENPHLVAVEKLFVLVPSFLRTYIPGTSTYSSRGQYPPSVIGGYPVDVWPFGDRRRERRGDKVTSEFNRPLLRAIVDIFAGPPPA